MKAGPGRGGAGEKREAFTERGGERPGQRGKVSTGIQRRLTERKELWLLTGRERSSKMEDRIKADPIRTRRSRSRVEDG